MTDGNLVGTIDVAELMFYAFVLFFIALVFYLRREDRREGYPLEDELTGRVESTGGPLHTAEPKTFRLPHDKGSVVAPLPRTEGREPVDIPAERTFRAGGAPVVPTGDPLADGIGPAAWAERSRWPDLDAEGHPRIIPMGTDSGITVAKQDADPRGMIVKGADGEVAGTVSDIWVDRAEHIIRYLEVATTAGPKVLAPMPMSIVKGRKGEVHIDALNADQFAGAPQLETPGQITRYEEERVSAYFGGGYLYATPERQEAVI
ncbi:photosynthetic reaction center subunit H [Parasphingopyxis sp.]|uniref:photosynthetic reaction center subunit H n=1 Tax=Parasphingopyxis sp. TaxID=1920299 RepID=UPI0026119856|nr:photosynthetic reaction center subunit H [Parasphingopyxis sp.]